MQKWNEAWTSSNIEVWETSTSTSCTAPFVAQLVGINALNVPCSIKQFGSKSADEVDEPERDGAEARGVRCLSKESKADAE